MARSVVVVLTGLIVVSSIAILLRTPCVPAAESDPERWTPIIPARLTAYDIATRRELFYRRQTAPAIAGNSVSEWIVLQGLEVQLGAWIAPFVEASRISTAIANSFPIGTQEPTRKLDELVHECARVLGLRKPEVFVRNSPFTVAYVTVVDGRPMLTLTSGLLSLYDERPRELRFIVGRELGRIKCGHVDERTKAYAIFMALQSVNLAIVPDEYQLALSTLALGRLMSAFREMEFSADRAGLLCCQDVEVAFQAMLRQLHGLKADSTWINPESPESDPQDYLKAIEYWENIVCHVRPERQKVLALRHSCGRSRGEHKMWWLGV